MTKKYRKQIKISIPSIRIFLTYIILILIFVSCKKDNQDNLLLSLLMNNRMTVLLKGTFATDDPLDPSQINGNAIFLDPDEPTPIDTNGMPSYKNLPFYLDIGEIRMSSKLDPLMFIDSAKKSAKFWDTLSPYRQVYCSQLYSVDPDLDSCGLGGLVNYVEFMNGRGAVYPSQDVGAATYTHVGVFLRSIVTGYGRVNGVKAYAKFDNNDVAGVNLMVRSNYNPDSSSTERQLLPPQFFPLEYDVAMGQQVVMDQDFSLRPIILEIRFNMKENFMAHSITTSQGLNATLVGFSDWRKNHVGQEYIGGSVLSRARMIYPDMSTQVKITGGTESNRHYYALYITNECADFNGKQICDKNTDFLPLAATPVRNGKSTLKDIMGGSYILQCRYDAVYDGYPEQVLSEKIITVPQGPDELEIACDCGASTTTGCP